MYLTIKSYSEEIFNKFYKLYGSTNVPRDGIVFDELMVDGVKITFYNNLTILFSGKLSERIIKDIDILVDQNLYVGTDEVGIGEGVGPIVVGAIKFKSLEDKKQVILAGIKDSKKLDHKDIVRLAKIIKKHSIGHIRMLPPVEFNTLYKKIPNMKQINALMQNDVLKEFDPTDVKVTDAFVNETKFNEYLALEGALKFSGKFILEQKAEEKYLEVACGAIVAKDAYNEWMINYCKENNIPLQVGKKVQAQKLYLDHRDGKVNIPNPNELVKDWSK